jgi:hypothetical protein
MALSFSIVDQCVTTNSMVDDRDADGGGEDFRRGHRRISASDAGTVACRVHYCKMCGLLKIKYNKAKDSQ